MNQNCPVYFLPLTFIYLALLACPFFSARGEEASGVSAVISPYESVYEGLSTRDGIASRGFSTGLAIHQVTSQKKHQVRRLNFIFAYHGARDFSILEMAVFYDFLWRLDTLPLAPYVGFGPGLGMGFGSSSYDSLDAGNAFFFGLELPVGSQFHLPGQKFLDISLNPYFDLGFALTSNQGSYSALAGGIRLQVSFYSENGFFN